ncbi:MAG: hypothetical protein AAGJ79_14075 [Verrucomicrobiota bacterium]
MSDVGDDSIQSPQGKGQSPRKDARPHRFEASRGLAKVDRGLTLPLPQESRKIAAPVKARRRAKAWRIDDRLLPPAAEDEQPGQAEHPEGRGLGDHHSIVGDAAQAVNESQKTR